MEYEQSQPFEPKTANLLRNYANQAFIVKEPTADANQMNLQDQQNDANLSHLNHQYRHKFVEVNNVRMGNLRVRSTLLSTE